MTGFSREMTAVQMMSIISISLTLLLVLFWHLLKRSPKGPTTMRWAPGTLPGFIEQLLHQPSTFVKVFSRHTLLYSVHVASLPLTKIRIRSPRFVMAALFWPSSFYHEPPIWKYDLRIQGRRDGPSLKVLRQVSAGWQSFLASHPEMSHEERIQKVSFLLRAVGFFMNSNVSLHTLDFESAEFLETLIQVGQTLPWQQFVIYITLPSPLETHISVSLSFRGLLKHAKQEVFVSMDKVKLLAKRKLLDSGFKTADVIMKKMIDTIEDTETDVEFVARSRTVSSQEEWVDMLSELEVQRFKNKEKVAACSTNRLKELNFTSSQDSVNDSSVLLANAFRKKLKWSHGARPVFDLFMLTITAAKLGLPAKVLQSNTDFYMFARKNALHRYFLVFNHQVRYDPLTLEVSVLYKGQFEKWKSIAQIIPRSLDDPLVMTGHYSRQGIVDEGLYDWTEMKPFLRALPPNATSDRENAATGLPVKIKHDWGDRYILEVCSWIVEEPRLGGDHTWFRLKTPDGLIYSVGQYRPKKFGFHEQFVFPMKIKTSQFSSPDLCEFWTGTYRTLSMEISQIQFEAMKRQIEIDQGKKEHVYQIYQENCVQYFISVARLAGILFPTKIHLSDLLITQPRLKSIRKSFNSSHWIPGIMKSGAHMLWIMTINVANVLLGASMIDHDLKNDPRANDIQPYIQKWTDLIDAEKVIAHHPFVIGDFIARQVEEWREAKIQELEFRYGRLSQEDKKSVHFEEEIASIHYALPPWYRLPSIDRVLNDA